MLANTSLLEDSELRIQNLVIFNSNQIVWRYYKSSEIAL